VVKYILALMNDNTIEPISLTIKITAIQQIDYWNTKIQVINVLEDKETTLIN
jgi:hypothetical protein